MEDEDFVLPSMDGYNYGDEIGLPSMGGIPKKQPTGPKLPANMNPQQIKRFMSQAGKSITDTQARELSSLVSGKSFAEATSLAGEYLRPKPQVSVQETVSNAFMPSSFQGMERPAPPAAPPAEVSVQEEFPLVAAPKPYQGEQGTVDINQQPDFSFNRVGEEITRPKSQSEIEQNISMSMIDEFKKKDKDVEYLFELLDQGKLADIDLGPLGHIGLGNLTKQRRNEIKFDLMSIKGAENSAKYITNLATIKSIQEASTKNVARLIGEVDAMNQDPNHDPKLLQKKKNDLYEQAIINQVSNKSEKPFEKYQLEKNINRADYLVNQLPLLERAAVATERASIPIASLGLSMVNSFAEFYNKYSPEGISDKIWRSIMEATTDQEFDGPTSTSFGDAFKTLAKSKQDDLENYKQSNELLYLAGQKSVLDGLNAVNFGEALGQTVGSMGVVIGASLAGGPVAGVAAGYMMVYGDAVDAARKAGFNEVESEIYGQILAVGTGLLEELPVGKLLEGWTSSMLKRSVLNLVRTEVRAGTPKATIVKKVTDYALEMTAKGIQQGAPEGVTEVLQGGQEYLTQAAFNNYFKEKEDPGFELPTFQQFGKQSAEAFVLGFFGGSAASVVGDIGGAFSAGSSTYSKIAQAAIRDNETFNNLNLIADGLMTAGKITKQERDSFVGNLKIAQEAKAALPKYIKDDNVRQRSIELILQKKRLEADMATVDPSMQDGYKERLVSIQSELKSIADQKWKAPANPVVFTTVPGMEAMTTDLINNSSKENAAGTFVSTIESGKGFISNLIKSIENDEPLPRTKAERAIASLEALAKSFVDAPVKTEMTQKAAKQAQEIADQVKQYSNITESAEQQMIPGLDFSPVADRILLSVPSSELESIAEVPADIQEAYQDIINGDDVSPEDADNVQSFLYGKYKDLNDLKGKLEDKLEGTTSKSKQAKLTESINAIGEMQKRLSGDIQMLGKYKGEARINNETTGKTQTAKTKPVVRQEAIQEEEILGEEVKLSEQELADMEYDGSNPSEAIASMIDEQPDASKIYKLLNGAIKFINAIAPNVKIYVHTTSQEFFDAVVATSGERSHGRGDDGMYVGGAGGKPKAVHFNLEAMLGKKDPKKRAEALRTFAHEAMHVGLQTIFGNDQAAFKTFQDKLSKVLESSDLAFLNKFSESYRDPKKQDITAEEFLAELGGMMSAERRNIPKPILARIAQLINNTIVAGLRKIESVRKTGKIIDSNMFFKDINDSNDVIDFFNAISKSTRTGNVKGVQGKAETLSKQQAGGNLQPGGNKARKVAADNVQDPELPITRARAALGDLRDKKHFMYADLKYPDVVFKDIDTESEANIAINFYKKIVDKFNKEFDRDVKITTEKTTDGRFAVVVEYETGLKPKYFSYPTEQMGEHHIVDALTNEVPLTSLRHELIHEMLVKHITDKFERINTLDKSADAATIEEVQRNRAFNYTLEDVFFERLVEDIERLPDGVDTFEVDTYGTDVTNRLNEEIKGKPTKEKVMATLNDLLEGSNPWLVENLNKIFNGLDYTKINDIRDVSTEVGRKFKQRFNSAKNILPRDLQQKIYDFTELFNKEYQGVQTRLEKQIKESDGDLEKPTTRARKADTEAQVLFTVATKRAFDIRTEYLKSYTNKYDKLVKMKIENILKMGIDKFNKEFSETAKYTLVNYAEILKSNIPRFKAKYNVGEPFLGSWQGFYEPSMNLNINISDDTDTSKLSDLFNKISEETSQDAYIIEMTSDLDEAFQKDENKLQLFEYQGNGISVYPQVIAKFPRELTPFERTQLAKSMKDAKFESYSIGPNFVKISVFDNGASSDPNTDRAKEREDRISFFNDQKTTFENAIKGENTYSEGVELSTQIKRSAFVEGKKTGENELQRKYDRRDVFKAFKPSEAGPTTRARRSAESGPARGNRLFNEPLADAKTIADKYYESTFGRKAPNYTGTRYLDTKNAKRISDAFLAMKHDPQNLEVAKAYRQMIKETQDQFEEILAAGYTVVMNDNDAYASSGDMIDDLRNNKSLNIFSTEAGFGDTPITAEQRRDNPLLAKTKFKDANGRALLANDLFRFVHDFFGHAKLGNSFGAKGEENAWNVHARMYSPLARRAMTTETRGQNSYFNFSGDNKKLEALREKGNKQREEGDLKGAEETTNKIYEISKFADQKVGLMPEEFSQIDETNEGDRQEELGLPVPTTRARRSIEEDPAKVDSDNMPMSAGNILYNDSEVLPKPEKKIKNAAVAIELQKAAAQFWGGSIITSDNITPEQEEVITNVGIQEAINALEDNKKENAANWYSTAIQVAIAVAGVIHPELVSRASAMKYGVFAKEKDPEGAARMALRMALAITSQNLNVDVNTKYAEEQFDYFKKNGRFDSKKKYGAKAPAISSNLELANTIIEKMGLNAAEEFISNGFTVAALEVAFKEATGKKVKISGLRNDDVNGAAIFGPKIGQGFLQNLMGKFDPVTIDLWMRRTWGRWTGDVVGDGVTEDRMAKLYMTVMQGIKNKELKITLPKEFKKHKPVQVKNDSGELTWTMDNEFTFDRENDVDFVNELNKIADEIRLIADNHYKNIHYIPMTKYMYAKFLSGEISYVQASNKLKALNERQKEKYKVYAAAQKAKGLKPLAQNDKKVKDGETIKGWLSLQNEKDGRIFIPTNEEISAKKPEWGNAAKNIISDLNPIDIPSNQDRRVITRVVNNIRKGLVKRGYDVTNADVQAILWYPEKDIWAKMRGEDPSKLKLSYDNQFIEIATDRGLGEQAQAIANEIRGRGAERTSTAPNEGPNESVRGVANAEPTTRARRSQVDVTEQIAQLREQEQAENDATDPNDKAKLKEIYDRYDKLITPLLEQEKGETTTRARRSQVEDIVRYDPTESIKDKDMDTLGDVLNSKKISPLAEPEITDFGDTVVFEYNNMDEDDTKTRITFNRNNNGTLSSSGVKVEKNTGSIRGTDRFAKYIASQSTADQEPTTRARRTQPDEKYFNPDKAADQGTKEDRKDQQKIYDLAKAFIDKFRADGGDKYEMQTLLELYLEDNGYKIKRADATRLIDFVNQGTRPEYTQGQDGGRYTYREGQETRKSLVLQRIKDKLENLGQDKRLNRRIVERLKKSLLYTVENQEDALRIAQLAVEEFGGIDGAESIEDLFDMSNEFSGAIKTFIVGSVLNDAYRLAKKAEKGSEEQKRYEDVVEKASNLLAERARENGREIAALYKLYLTSPEGMYTIEAKKFLQDVQSRFGTKKQQEKIDKLTKELIDAKAEAARLAAKSAAVQAAVTAATGGPSKPPTPSRPPKPPTKPLTDTQENLKKERGLFQQLRDKLKSLGNTRARRQYPAGVDAEIVDILSELARVNFKRGIFNYFDIKDAIVAKLAKDNITISVEHFQEMWTDVWREAAKEEVSYNADKLAKRIIEKAKKDGPSPAPMTDPIKLIKDELLKRATQDLKQYEDGKETEFDKLRRLLFHYDSRTKPIWDEARAVVEQQIDDLDPIKYSPADKAALKAKLDNFFNDTLANALPRSKQKITDTFEEDVKAKEFKIQEILLKPNAVKDATKEEFVRDLAERMVENTNISYSDAQAIAEAFAKEYDMHAQKTAEKILARSVPKMKNSAKILRKSSAERAFEMIKYGAIELDAELTDKDGNLTDLNVLFAEIFGLPQMTAEIRQNLKDFAEQIAKTKPNSILRQQFYNDMMSYIEFQKIRDVNVGSILLAQIYNNVLFSMDTMTKAFNSNIILMPAEFLTQTLRAAADGDFRLIPLMAKSFFGRKGDKNTEVWFKEGFNNARLALAGMVQTENFSTTNIAETMSKQNDSPALKAWGKFARKSGRYLGALDTLFTAAATQARVSDLMYDEIKYQAKLNGIKLTNKQIAESVANIQGIKFKPDNSPVADAITQANEEFIEAYGPNVDWNDNTKLALYRARVMEIVRDGASERAIKYFEDQGINLKLESSTIEDIKSLARELASKVGLMGTPPGSWGVLSTILQIPGMFYPGSQAILGNMFAKAPMNAAEKILQGNTLIGGIVLAIRLAKNQRGLVTSSEVTTRFYDSFGIRTEMYGRTTSRLGGVIDINMEKKELIARYVMVQAAVIPISYFAVTAITGAIANALGGDDDDLKEDIIKDGILAMSKMSEDKRQMLFFGDKTAPVGSKRYEGQWKKLGLYVTGPMYGYTARGAYSKMTALKSMYGIEPYSIYCYGRRITGYNDNPFLASIFGSVGANSDVALFNNSPENPTESYTDMVMMTSFLQMSLVKDQAAIKPLMEWADAVGAKGVYSAPELDKFSDRAALVIQKKLANLASNIVLPAAVKNFNQNMKSIMGEAAMDPRGFREFLVVRVPILDLLIKNEKTDHFGFPIEEKTKLVLPVGTQGLMYAFGPDGKLTFPQVDQVMNGAGGKYYAMFKKYNNDKYNNPDITSYIERNSNNSGESKVVKLNLDQLTQVRDEYKKIMREFVDKKYNKLKSGSNEAMFQGELDLFLGLYKGNVMGYKGYILKKLFGKNAYVNLTTEELTEDALEKIKPVN